MIKVKSLIDLLKKNNCNFFTGVPDSVLKELSVSLKTKSKTNHIIATSEGSAVSIGIGYYLSKNKVPCIYMQNSGLSNAINPLISIAHKKVYSIPLILIIGWRGSPKLSDEPQHNVKGRITREILKLLNIKFTILRKKKDLIKFDKQIKYAKKNNSIVACLIENKTLEKNNKQTSRKNFYNLDKEFFLKTLLNNIPNKSKIISSTGYNSRELLYLREKYKFENSRDFYMVGGMGHTASVALGCSLSNKNKTICIDGDGSLLMHLGSLKTAGDLSNKNYKYILLNNNVHDSVGGQITYANNVDFKKLSMSLGFKNFYLIEKISGINKKIKNFINNKNASFLEARVSGSKIMKLPRPKDLIKIKKEFMKQ
jgi:phosphonopyruvate decarboxylase